MTTLKVGNIEHPTSGSLATINGTAPSNRNLIINGAMTVAQRGTSGTVTTAGNYPSVDRWSCNDGGIGGFTVSQSTDAPTGFANSAKWACTSTGSATNDVFHEQKLEGQDLQLLEYGTASAKSFTVSFWVKSNKTGEYSLWIENNDANRYFTTPGYTINAANTWEFKTITVPGDTGGSGFTNDNGVSLKIRWHLVLRTSFQGTPSGAWSTSASLRGQGSHVNFADSTSNEWYITGVQLEAGSVATPFEHRSYGDELRRCQRYFQVCIRNEEFVTACVTSSSGANTGLAFVNEMRAAPTVTLATAGSSAGNVAFLTTGGGTPSTIGSHEALSITTYGFRFKASGYSASGWTSGAATNVYGYSTATVYTASAEL
jgi:hypothetical protein